MIFAPVTAAAAAPPDAPSGQVAKLRKAVTVQGMLRHEQALQEIADANGGTRASGTPGYAASVDYVVDQLQRAGYDPQVQTFEFASFEELADPVFERTAPDPRTYVEGDEFATMQYSGSGDVTAEVQEVNDNQFPPPAEPGSTAGCEATDFAGFVPGNVALIQRGTCTFADKATNAQNAGASAVVIFNEGQEGRTDTVSGTLGGADFTVPVIGTTFAVGEELHELLADDPVTLHIETSTISEPRDTYNVLADTERGDTSRVVVQGSHLDSVVPGPGINDNGSGSAYNLESAIQLAEKNIKPRNTVRFAFWGAEESGLIGSQFYVDSLSNDELNDISLNLNFDMLASPNFVRFVYDGDGSDTDTAGPEGSAQIERTFLRYFDSRGLETDPTAFDGRSDYGPFIAEGVPAGGLFSGAEVLKTPEQAEVYGGTAGVAYDHCYHQACDTIDNVNTTSLDQLSDGAATTLATYALTAKPVTQTGGSKRATAQADRLSERKADRKAARSDYLGDLLQR